MIHILNKEFKRKPYEFVVRYIPMGKDGKKYPLYINSPIQNDKQNSWRVDSLLTKEKETIQWIKESITSGIFWDIGANIGQYSLFAAAFNGVKVYSFEPETQNYSVLIKNIILTDLHDNITSYPIALSDKPGYGTIDMELISGTSNNQLLRKGVPKSGIRVDTIDNLVEQGLDVPDHIKIDVDGLEYQILKGGEKTLPKVKNLLVEIEDKDKENILSLLSTKGFIVKSITPLRSPTGNNYIFQNEKVTF